MWYFNFLPFKICFMITVVILVDLINSEEKFIFSTSEEYADRLYLETQFEVSKITENVLIKCPKNGKSSLVYHKKAYKVDLELIEETDKTFFIEKLDNSKNEFYEIKKGISKFSCGIYNVISMDKNTSEFVDGSLKLKFAEKVKTFQPKFLIIWNKAESNVNEDIYDATSGEHKTDGCKSNDLIYSVRHKSKLTSYSHKNDLTVYDEDFIKVFDNDPNLYILSPCLKLKAVADLPLIDIDVSTDLKESLINQKITKVVKESNDKKVKITLKIPNASRNNDFYKYTKTYIAKIMVPNIKDIKSWSPTYEETTDNSFIPEDYRMYRIGYECQSCKMIQEQDFYFVPKNDTRVDEELKIVFKSGEFNILPNCSVQRYSPDAILKKVIYESNRINVIDFFNSTSDRVDNFLYTFKYIFILLGEKNATFSCVYTYPDDREVTVKITFEQKRTLKQNQLVENCNKTSMIVIAVIIPIISLVVVIGVITYFLKEKRNKLPFKNSGANKNILNKSFEKKKTNVDKREGILNHNNMNNSSDGKVMNFSMNSNNKDNYSNMSGEQDQKTLNLSGDNNKFNFQPNAPNRNPNINPNINFTGPQQQGMNNNRDRQNYNPNFSY